MTDCKICGVKENLQYQCNYCGSVFCSEHRLPENHDCPALIVFEEVDTSWFTGERDISELQSNDVDIPDEVIEEIEDAANMEARSEAVRNKKTREMIEKLGDAAEVSESDGEIVVNDESGTPPYETIEPGTVGSTIEPDYESSPDLNPDGSLKTADRDEKESPSEDDTSDISPLARMIFVLFAIGVLATVVYFVLL